MEELKENVLYNSILPRIEQLSGLVTAAGLGLRYLLFPIGNTLLLIGLSSLAMVCFLQAFAPVAAAEEPAAGLPYAPANSSAQPVMLQASLAKIQYIAAAVTLIGVLFKLLFWFGSGTLLVAGVPVLVLALVLQAAGGQALRPTLVIIAALGGFVWAVSTDTLVRQFYRDDPALVEKMLFQQAHPRDRAANAEVQRLLQARRQRH